MIHTRSYNPDNSTAPTRNRSINVSENVYGKEEVENSSDPKFVPITRSAREMKLLYSEYKEESLKSKKLNANIAQVLKVHMEENRKARRIIS